MRAGTRSWILLGLMMASAPALWAQPATSRQMPFPYGSVPTAIAGPVLAAVRVELWDGLTAGTLYHQCSASLNGGLRHRVGDAGLWLSSRVSPF